MTEKYPLTTYSNTFSGVSMLTATLRNERTMNAIKAGVPTSTFICLQIMLNVNIYDLSWPKKVGQVWTRFGTGKGWAIYLVPISYCGPKSI